MDIMCAPNTLGTFSECFTYGCKVMHKFIVYLLIQRKEKPSRKICRAEVYRRKIKPESEPSENRTQNQVLYVWNQDQGLIGS
jgi:hypothetical protein